MELKEIHKDNIIGIQAAVHTLHSDAITVTLSTPDLWVEYENNGGTYENGNTTIWDKANNILNIPSNSVLYAKINLIIRTTVTTAAANTLLHVQAYIDRPVIDGDIIIIGGQSIYPKKQNVAHEESVCFPAYIGQEMIDYGVKFRTKLDATLSSSTDLDNRKLLIMI